MPDLDFEFTSVSRKGSFIRALWMYYLYIYAPRMVRHLLLVILCLLAYIYYSRDYVILMLGGMSVLITLAEFPVYCRRMVDVMSRLGFFGKENHVHLYSDRVYSRCGGNESTTSYSSFSGYFQVGDFIILTMGKNLFSSCFSKDVLAGHTPELVACLEAAGVKRIKFFTIKRWLFAAVFAVILLLCIFIR